MTKFEEEFNYLIELSGKVLLGQVDAETFEKNRIAFFEKYETDQQQALPVVPDYVGNAVMKINLEHLFTGYTNGINEKAKNWLERHKGVKSLGYYVCQLRFQGFTVEKPQLFYLKNKLTGMWLMRDEVDEVYPYDHTFNRCRRGKFTQQEIDSMQTGSYELVPVEDGE
ncbi:DUF1642 domain-containing protein [Lactococcus lactis]|uniref:DUF1642 domain-containing protein n=1 Tax=Lactococcus lactis TaxID=1358 RepID=UPI0015C3D38B|nr:DUF1642 domain-containing protein [Lactococcus lactis]QLF91322.1 DUF1642 domain-containing protein [Lactococcus lactis subsp. lactis]